MFSGPQTQTSACGVERLLDCGIKHAEQTAQQFSRGGGVSHPCAYLCGILNSGGEISLFFSLRKTFKRCPTVLVLAHMFSEVNKSLIISAHIRGVSPNVREVCHEYRNVMDCLCLPRTHSETVTLYVVVFGRSLSEVTRFR